jgi:hypothetical protein
VRLRDTYSGNHNRAIQKVSKKSVASQEELNSVIFSSSNLFGSLQRQTISDISILGIYRKVK